jgi:hypothetical protein
MAGEGGTPRGQVHFHNTFMKQRFYLYRRSGTFHLPEARTGE